MRAALALSALAAVSLSAVLLRKSLSLPFREQTMTFSIFPTEAPEGLKKWSRTFTSTSSLSSISHIVTRPSTRAISHQNSNRFSNRSIERATPRSCHSSISTRFVERAATFDLNPRRPKSLRKGTASIPRLQACHHRLYHQHRRSN